MDGVLVQPDATYPGFEITNNGRFVRLATNFSLVVESDGDSLSVVKAPPSFAGKMTGLCGNADGNPENDWITSIGTNVKDLPLAGGGPGGGKVSLVLSIYDNPTLKKRTSD